MQECCIFGTLESLVASGLLSPSSEMKGLATAEGQSLIPVGCSPGCREGSDYGVLSDWCGHRP